MPSMGRLFFGRHGLVKGRRIDNKALMGSRGYFVHFVKGLNGEGELSPFHFFKCYPDRDRHPRGRCRQVTDVDMCADSHFPRPVKKWIDGFDAGELKESHHKPGGEHFRHGAALGDVRKEVGYGFIIGDFILEFKRNTGLQRMAHRYLL